MNRILFIGGDIGLSELLGQLLELEGFKLTKAHNGQQGLELALSCDFDLILLEVMLPKLNGFEVLKALRLHKHTSVMMLTTKGDEIARVVGLETGADDYLSKSFNDRKLVARVRAIIRTSGLGISELQNPKEQVYDDILLDLTRQKAYCQDTLLILTSTEFSLLHTLANNAGELMAKEILSQQILGKKLMPFDRSLDMHLSNLRKKLPPRDDGRPRIKTIRGRGYIWIP